jgi:hypothetical protein
MSQKLAFGGLQSLGVEVMIIFTLAFKKIFVKYQDLELEFGVGTSSAAAAAFAAFFLI